MLKSAPRPKFNLTLV